MKKIALVQRLMTGMAVLALAALVGCAQQAATKPPNDNIRLIQSKRGAAIAISDKLLFEVGKSDLNSNSKEALDQIASILKNSDSKGVMIEGHTDNRGSKEFNDGLSLQRAMTVRQALINRGASADRLDAKGFGFSEPIESNDTDAGRAKNRRVEVVFPNESLDDLKKISEKFKSLF